MKHRPLKQVCGLLATAAITLVLAGCNGSAGQNGANGATGATGPAGPAGGSGPTGPTGPVGQVALNVAALTPDEWANLSLTGTVQSVAVSASSGAPVVNFTVTDKNNMPITGLASFTTKNSTALVKSYANVAFTIAKLVPRTDDVPSHWVNYIVTSMPTTASTGAKAPTKPTTDNTGNLVDNGNGTYTYTFYRDIVGTQAWLDSYSPYTAPNVRADLGDVSFEKDLVHRVVIQIGGAARNTSTNTSDGSNTGIPAVNMKASANIWYDFVPSRALGSQAVALTEPNQRNIVDINNCNKCHSKLAVHGGGVRQDTQFCVTCHTDQRKFGAAEAVTTSTGYDDTTRNSSGSIIGSAKINNLATGDFPTFIHKLHMGEGLKKTGYYYGGLFLNETTYPQDQRNCAMCHTKSTTRPQGDNWKDVPSRRACGACHDDINWTTGANHGQPTNGGQQLNDKNCVNCHGSAAVVTQHTQVLPPNEANAFVYAQTGPTVLSPGNNNTNASFVAAYTNQLPPGAHKITWDLNKFVLNSLGQPEFTFAFKEDGVIKPFLTYAAGTVESFWANYVGGPSFYIALGQPQDGIASPADWNVTNSIYFPNAWRNDGKTAIGSALGATAATTLTGPDPTTGYYKLTMTGVKVPSNATMVTGGIGYTYGLSTTPPLTQTDVPGYPYTKLVRHAPFLVDTTWTGSWEAGGGQGGVSVPAPNASKILGALPTGFPATSADGKTGLANTARRAIVTTAKCNDCHVALGIFTEETYHAGQRNDATTCTFCHNVNKTNSGWAVNIKDAVHSLHASGKRTNKFSWEASAGSKMWNITYPAILNDCEACHVPGAYDFSLSANASVMDRLLWSSTATGTMKKVGDAVSSSNSALITYVGVATDSIDFTDPTKVAVAPWAVPGTAYGKVYSGSIPTAAPSITQAAAGTLVISPIASACYACHDSNVAKAHMQNNGASINSPRSAAGVLPTDIEQCMICHGNGKTADIRVVHSNW